MVIGAGRSEAGEIEGGREGGGGQGTREGRGRFGKCGMAGGGCEGGGAWDGEGVRSGRMYVCMYVRMYVCMYVRMYVCVCIRMYACMCVWSDFRIDVCLGVSRAYEEEAREVEGSFRTHWTWTKLHLWRGTLFRDPQGQWIFHLLTPLRTCLSIGPAFPSDPSTRPQGKKSRRIPPTHLAVPTRVHFPISYRYDYLRLLHIPILIVLRAHRTEQRAGESQRGRWGIGTSEPRQGPQAGTAARDLGGSIDSPPTSFSQQWYLPRPSSRVPRSARQPDALDRLAAAKRRSTARVGSLHHHVSATRGWAKADGSARCIPIPAPALGAACDGRCASPSLHPSIDGIEDGTQELRFRGCAIAALRMG
ncbi:hypothetical protein PMIN04_000891 [Paraphaeosphaeria minitans]